MSDEQVRVACIPEGIAGERVDAAVSRMFGFSRSRAAELAEAGKVHLDERTVGKSARVSSGQMIEITIPNPPKVDPRLVPEVDLAAVRVVHEDADLVVVDKPVGVVSHPTLGFDGPSVTGVLKARGIQIATSGAPERRGVVQRLDVGTSGLMVLAKSESAYSDLKQQFRDREPEKIYHALVQGLPDPVRGTIDAPIGRHPSHDWKFAVIAGGRESVTHYKVLEAFRFASLLEVHLETGRTHQIRVHMSAIRHPCVGDLTYGADPTLSARVGLDRQWLHAVNLSFRHPQSGEWVEFASDYPPDLESAIRVLSPD